MMLMRDVASGPSTGPLPKHCVCPSDKVIPMVRIGKAKIQLIASRRMICMIGIKPHNLSDL